MSPHGQPTACRLEVCGQLGGGVSALPRLAFGLPTCLLASPKHRFDPELSPGCARSLPPWGSESEAVPPHSFPPPIPTEYFVREASTRATRRHESQQPNPRQTHSLRNSNTFFVPSPPSDSEQRAMAGKSHCDGSTDFGAFPSRAVSAGPCFGLEGPKCRVSMNVFGR